MCTITPPAFEDLSRKWKLLIGWKMLNILISFVIITMIIYVNSEVLVTLPDRWSDKLK